MTEEISKNTAENLRESLKILKEKDWHKVIIITNEYHLPRALQLFKYILDKDGYEVQCQGIACEDVLMERSPHYKNLVSHYKFPESLLKSPKQALAKGGREILRRVIIHLDKDDKVARFLAHQFRR